MAGNVPAIACIGLLDYASTSLNDVASLEESLPRPSILMQILILKRWTLLNRAGVWLTRTDVEAHPSALCPYWSIRRVPVERERRLREKLRHIERVLSDENLDLFPDFTKKLSILRALEYTSDMDVMQLVVLHVRSTHAMSCADRAGV